MDGRIKGSSPVASEAKLDLVELRGDHILMEWTPGRKVVFYRALNSSIIFTLFFVILGAGLLLLMYYAAQVPNVDIFPILLLLIFGCLFGGMGLNGCYHYLPRTVVFDWSQSAMTCASLLGKKVVPFSRISEILLKGERRGGRFGQWFAMYRVRMEIVDHLDVNAPSFVLIVNSDYCDSLDLALERLRPIFNGLVRTLNLQGQVIDDRGKVIFKK